MHNKTPEKDLYYPRRLCRAQGSLVVHFLYPATSFTGRHCNPTYHPVRIIYQTGSVREGLSLVTYRDWFKQRLPASAGGEWHTEAPRERVLTLDS